MFSLRLTVVTAALFASAATAQPAAQGPAWAPEWNWLALYDQPDSWNGALSALQLDVDALTDCQGRLGGGPDVLGPCLALRFERAGTLERLAAWLALYESQYGRDVSRRDALARVAAPSRLAFARLDAETARLDTAQVDALPDAADYRPWFDQLRARRAHIPPPDVQEKRLALAATAAPFSDVYHAIVNAPLTWPTVTLSSGQPVLVDPLNFPHLIWRADSDDRSRVTDLYWVARGMPQEPLARLLEGRYQADARLAVLQAHAGVLDENLDAQGLPPDSLSLVRHWTDEAKPRLAQYFRMRGLELGTGQLEVSDLQQPLSPLPGYSLEQAERILQDALAPLRGQASKVIGEGFQGGWLQLTPGHKAFVVTAGPGTHPYIGLDYRNDVPSLLELARLWGVALHWHFSSRQAPAALGTWPLIEQTVATVAELLVLNHLLDNAETQAQRLAWLGVAADFWLRRFYLPAVEADFEHALREWAAAGDSFPVDAVNKRYKRNIRRIFPEIVEDHPSLQQGWTARDSLYEPYASLRQALATAAAADLADGLIKKGGTDTTAFRRLLEAGRSQLPGTLLTAAGVDLAGSGAYERVARALQTTLDRMEAIDPGLAADAEPSQRDEILKRLRQNPDEQPE